MNLTGLDIALAVGEIEGGLVEAADRYRKPSPISVITCLTG